MSDTFLGEFEQMVLLAILRQGEDAYGLAIKEELEDVAGRSPSSGSLYTTLDRLQKKGLVASRAGDPSSDRGGRPRRYLRVTPEGVAALSESRGRLMALWDGVERVLDR